MSEPVFKKIAEARGTMNRCFAEIREREATIQHCREELVTQPALAWDEIQKSISELDALCAVRLEVIFEELREGDIIRIMHPDFTNPAVCRVDHLWSNKMRLGMYLGYEYKCTDIPTTSDLLVYVIGRSNSED